MGLPYADFPQLRYNPETLRFSESQYPAHLRGEARRILDSLRKEVVVQSDSNSSSQKTSSDSKPSREIYSEILPPTTIKFQGRPYVPLGDLWKSTCNLYPVPKGYERIVLSDRKDFDSLMGAQFLYKEHYLGDSRSFVDFYVQLLLPPERQLVNRFVEDFHVSCFRSDFSSLGRTLIQSLSIRPLKSGPVPKEDVQSMIDWAAIDWDVIPPASDTEQVYAERVRMKPNSSQRQHLDDWKARVDQHYVQNPPGVFRPPNSVVRKSP